MKKRAQEQKSKILTDMSRKAQEEMVGFAMIVIIVAIIILIFISFSINRNVQEPLESYEVNSFISSTLQYTSDCQDYISYLSLQKVILKCADKEKCLDGKEACEVLNETLIQITQSSWKLERGGLTKGYVLNITEKEKSIYLIKEGNLTSNYKGSMQALGRDEIQIFFTVYY